MTAGSSTSTAIRVFPDTDEAVALQDKGELPTGGTGAAPAITPEVTSASATTLRLEPWRGVPIPPNCTIDRNGVFQSENRTRIAGPVWVHASTFDPHSKVHGLVVRWLDLYGVPCEIAVTRDQLHVVGSSLPARLASNGLLITPGDERKLLRYLAQFDVPLLQRWDSASRVGWLEEADGTLAYMLPPPAGLVAGTDHSPVIFQPERESPSTASLYSRGTLESWNKHVVALCRDNPLLLFPILTALSAPLVRFAEIESGGFHYYGRSSHGKTTAAQTAASVWGNGADPAEAPDRAFIQKWNSTANAFEALLSAHNDGLLVLDEIHTCDAKDFGAVIYNMSGGKGRQALDRDRQLRRSRQWRAMYFSTGEISVLTRLQADGRAVHAGQLLRLIDIPIEGGTIVSSGQKTASAHADLLKSACARQFGVAGPALVRALIDEYADARALAGTVRAMLEHCAAALTPEGAPAEHRRAIKRFALLFVAGQLAVRLGVLTECTAADVERAIRTALRAWQTDGSNVPDRLRGLLNVQSFIERNISRFQRNDGESQVIPRDRAGFIGYETELRSHAYYLTRAGFAEACGGQDPRETARELFSRGFLVARENGRWTEKRDIGTGRHRVYIIPPSLLEFDPREDMAAGATGASGAHGETD